MGLTDRSLPVGEAASARVLSKSGQQPGARGQRGRLPRSGSARVGKGEQAVPVSSEGRRERGGVWWLVGSSSAGGPPRPELPQAPPPHPCTVMPRAHLWAAGGRWVQDSMVLTKMPPCVRASRGGGDRDDQLIWGAGPRRGERQGLGGCVGPLGAGGPQPLRDPSPPSIHARPHIILLSPLIAR